MTRLFTWLQRYLVLFCALLCGLSIISTGWFITQHVLLPLFFQPLPVHTTENYAIPDGTVKQLTTKIEERRQRRVDVSTVINRFQLDTETTTSVISNDTAVEQLPDEITSS